MGPQIGAGFQRKLLLLPVYVLCPIYFDLTIYPNDTDEPYAAVIISISTILNCSWFKYEHFPHQDTMTLLG